MISWERTTLLAIPVVFIGENYQFLLCDWLKSWCLQKMTLTPIALFLHIRELYENPLSDFAIDDNIFLEDLFKIK